MLSAETTETSAEPTPKRAFAPEISLQTDMRYAGTDLIKITGEMFALNCLEHELRADLYMRRWQSLIENAEKAVASASAAIAAFEQAKGLTPPPNTN